MTFTKVHEYSGSDGVRASLPTIICRAWGTSETGVCEFAVVEWSPELVNLVLARQRLWQTARSTEPRLARLEFWDGRATWYSSSLWGGIAVESDDPDVCTLESLLGEHGLEHLNQHDWAPCLNSIGPDTEAARTSSDCMVIEERGFWFAACPKHEDTTVETPMITYAQVLEWRRFAELEAEAFRK